MLGKMVGNPVFMRDESKELTLLVYDECSPNFSVSSIITNITYSGNGSDVFGSEICTCKPYLTYAIGGCIRRAQ